jgi:hypothetical protein
MIGEACITHRVTLVDHHDGGRLATAVHQLNANTVVKRLQAANVARRALECMQDPGSV